MCAAPAMSAPTSPGLLPQQGAIVGHIDTSERSNVPIYAAADCAASGEKSSGKDLAQATSTPQTLAAAVQAVRVRIEYTELLLPNLEALDQHLRVPEEFQTSFAKLMRAINVIPVDCAKTMVEMLQSSSLDQKTQAACMELVNERLSSTQG